MPLVGLLGQRFSTLVDHADGQRGCLCLRAPPAYALTETRQLVERLSTERSRNLKLNGRPVMGAYCRLDYTHRHAARMARSWR
jgi:hypothetical protein